MKRWFKAKGRITLSKKRGGRKRRSLGARVRRQQARGRAAAVRMRRRLGVEQRERRYNFSLRAVNNTKDNGVTFPVDSNVIMITPNAVTMPIDQGVGQGQRIGNRIKLTYASLRAIFLPINEGTANQTLPVIIRCMFMYDKRNPTSVPTPGQNGDFFQNGNSASGFDGTMNDLLRPINTDRYAVFNLRSFKVGWATTYGMGSGDPAQAYSANNEFKLMGIYKKNYMKHIVKNLRYDDNELEPASRGLWFFYYAVPISPNATALFNNNAARLTLQWMVKWTDV